MFLGSALAEQGQEEKGLGLMHRGFAAQRAIGGRILEQYWLALQIEAHLKVGQFAQGLAALNEAFAVAANGERIWEAEVYRLKGELALQQFNVRGSKVKVEASRTSNTQGPESPNPTAKILEPQREAEASFLKAVEVARKQQAKSLELRAVMSLVRLRQYQARAHATRITQRETRNKLAEAHRMLSEVYRWFTEGFDTKDLQEAKALLEELRH
jgi:predicted ATPase